MLTKTVSIPALPVNTNSSQPLPFPASPDMVQNKAQKLEERYLSKSAQRVEMPAPVGPPPQLLTAPKDLRKSFNAIQEKIISMEGSNTLKGPPALIGNIAQEI